MKHLKAFATTAQYEAYTADTENFITPNVSICNDNPTVVYYNPYFDPCASEKVETTYEWVEIGGVKWATKNVGAKTITDYGQYFSWGGVNGFTADQVTGDCHSKAFSSTDYELGNGGSSGAFDATKYNSTDGKTVLESVDDAATANMGSGWRMPTTAEYAALGDAVNTAWTADYQGSGVAGMICTDKTDSSKVLFFPACGRCCGGSVEAVGINGNYWSSSRINNSSKYAYYLHFGNRSVFWQHDDLRYLGYLVRGVVG